MPVDSDQPPPEDIQPPPPPPAIRRGRGLRLSTESAPAVPEPSPEAPAEPSPLPQSPARRGQGLRLSVNASAEPTPPPIEEAEASVVASASPVEEEVPISGAASPSVDEVSISAVAPAGSRSAPAQISYRQAGSGPPLLLIHGWSASSRLWLTTLDQLGGVRHSYALDMPGFGQSPAAGPADLATQARLALAAADQIGLARFDLAGHSSGAAVAAHIAAHWPERVGRLALISFGLRRFAPDQMALNVAQTPLAMAVDFWRPWLALWQPVTQTIVRTPPVRQILAGWLMEQPPADSAQWGEILGELAGADPRAYLDAVLAAAAPSLEPTLASISAPTLLLGGRSDRLAPPESLRAAQALIPGAQIQIIERCGHLPMLEQPGDYASALRAFLTV